MGKTGFGAWLRNNIAAIAVPIISGIVALLVSWGADIRAETELNNRIKTLEQQVAALDLQDEEFDDDFDDLEDKVNDKTRELENMLTREGRDLERTVIRMESRLDNLARRMALFDGIGAPSMGVMPAPSFEFDYFDDSYMLEE